MSLASQYAAVMCLCGDVGTRHRVGVRAGLAVRTSCKDCGCDGFAPLRPRPEPELEVSPASIPVVDPASGGQGGCAAVQALRQVAIVHLAQMQPAPPEPAPLSGTGRVRSDELAALLAERYAPGPPTGTFEDRQVRRALAADPARPVLHVRRRARRRAIAPATTATARTNQHERRRAG